MTQEGKQFQRTEDGHLILMTPEERKLLITDLTSRIEYGVICMIERIDDFGPRLRNEKLTGFCNEEGGYFYFDFCYGLTVDFAEKVKPYLRPMSSMTEEELYEVQEILGKGVEIHDVFISIVDSSINAFSYLELQAVFDWLNKHHFDYHGLIEKGLAIEAHVDMYK